jgi:predicted XRE-type DNA-binding protein
MSSSILDQLFPPAPPHNRVPKIAGPGGFDDHPEHKNDKGRSRREEVTTRWAAVYALELRGLKQAQIAEALNLSPTGISRIVTDERYLEYRERHLAALDNEFVAMKPLAFAALKGGLTSSDENTALRASEQWFKGAGYGGFSKTERASTSLTAEDVARALLGGGVNVQVNTQVNVASSKDNNE